MKKLIRLTESDLHRIVRESVKRIMEEEEWITPLEREKRKRQNWDKINPNKKPTFGDKFGDVFKKLKK